MVTKTKNIIKRSVDSKGRVVIPIKDAREVYILTIGDVLILSPDYKFILELNDLIEKIRVKKKLKALEEWFELIDKAGLDKLTPEIINRLVSKSMRDNLG